MEMRHDRRQWQRKDDTLKILARELEGSGTLIQPVSAEIFPCQRIDPALLTIELLKEISGAQVWQIEKNARNSILETIFFGIPLRLFRMVSGCDAC